MQDELQKIPLIKPKSKRELIAEDDHHLVECPADHSPDHDENDHDDVWNQLDEVKSMKKKEVV